MTAPLDPLQQQATADAVLKRAADQLRDLLKSTVRALDPFPEFPGSFFTYGIEVDLPGTLDSALGCVMLGDDGDLYELQIGLDPEQVDSSDPVAIRSEQQVPLTLPPAQYIPYAYRALELVVALLEARQAANTKA